MADQNDIKFRQLIVPHFEAAYNLARWLTGNDTDATDVLQEASLKAFRFMESLKSENPRAWFFQIVRNTSYTVLKARKKYVELDFEKDIEDLRPNPEGLLLQDVTAKELYEALDELPVQYREVIVLREIEETSYEDIAAILQIPSGTVMSRLARARGLLKKKLIAKGVGS